MRKEMRIMNTHLGFANKISALTARCDCRTFLWQSTIKEGQNVGSCSILSAEKKSERTVVTEVNTVAQ